MTQYELEECTFREANELLKKNEGWRVLQVLGTYKRGHESDWWEIVYILVREKRA